MHDIPAASPPMFLVVVLSRRMAEGMERANVRVRVPRGMGWPNDERIWYRFQGAICHLDDQNHYVAYFDCPSAGVVRFDDRQVVQVGFDAFASCAKNQMDVALVVFARETRETFARDTNARVAPVAAGGGGSGEGVARMQEGSRVARESAAGDHLGGTVKGARVGGDVVPIAEQSLAAHSENGPMSENVGGSVDGKAAQMAGATPPVENGTKKDCAGARGYQRTDHGTPNAARTLHSPPRMDAEAACKARMTPSAESRTTTDGGGGARRREVGSGRAGRREDAARTPAA